MGKSNKFDYTNRPNSGAKLGHIIGRDLEKEADKVIKDADRQAAKQRKVSTGSAASSTASTDGRDSVVHTLNIKVPGKQLGVEGACAMAAGLEIALRKGTGDACVLLEDLDLSNNGITTASLERLAPAIALSSRSLKEINLADNAIKVETEEEAAQWEAFLLAFEDCSSLQRLDFLNNAKLGARAMEILARVHIMEEDILPKASHEPTSSRNVIEASLDSEDDMPTPTAADFEMEQMRRRRRGLRSLPFLVLNNTGLNDAGALWLSYMIEDHYYPSQLSDKIDVEDTVAINAAHEGGRYCGIQWEDGEHTVGKDGLHLLRKTESIRLQRMFADVATVTTFELTGGNGAADELTDGPNTSGRRSMDRRHSRAKRGDRRTSIRSTHTPKNGDHEQSELDSIRKKIQRAVIDKHGAASVELWRAGLKMTSAARTLQGIGPESRDMTRLYFGPPMFNCNSSVPKSPRRRDSARPVTPSSDSKKNKDNRRQGTYAATLTANSDARPGEPELAITEVTNSPVTPKLIFKPHRKGAFSDGGDLLTAKLDALVVRDKDPRRYVRFQEDRMQETVFRNSGIPSHLPDDVVERITSYTLSDRERRLMSKKQRESVLAWASDRSRVVELEREWRKMADSAQVWMLLESISCLEYERE